ncbi:MAG: hypothetical protein V4592_07630 [Bacteroidota bacterium]
MKKLLLGLLCCFAFSAFAQDTVAKKNSIGKFEEQYMVLKSDKKVRQGSYRLYTDKKLVASGSYDKGVRVGLWSFYNDGALEQQYDYTANKLIVNNASKAISCEIEDKTQGDSIKNAVKVGGYNGLALLISSVNFEENVDAGRNQVLHVFTLDDKGEIKSWVASIKSSDGIKIVNQKIADISPEILQFIPAMVNGKAVASTITFNSEMKGMGPDADPGNGKANVRGGGGKRGRG